MCVGMSWSEWNTRRFIFLIHFRKWIPRFSADRRPYRLQSKKLRERNMVRHLSELSPGVMDLIRRGVALPAHPLALDEKRRLDAVRQRALTRYYMDAGAGGVAVGVHTTQFAIRSEGLYEQVLQIAAEVAAEGDYGAKLLVAGVTGSTDQA